MLFSVDLPCLTLSPFLVNCALASMVFPCCASFSGRKLRHLSSPVFCSWCCLCLVSCQHGCLVIRPGQRHTVLLCGGTTVLFLVGCWTLCKGAQKVWYFRAHTTKRALWEAYPLIVPMLLQSLREVCTCVRTCGHFAHDSSHTLEALPSFAALLLFIIHLSLSCIGRCWSLSFTPSPCALSWQMTNPF